MFAIIRQAVQQMEMLSSSRCTAESSAGDDYGSMCYDVGGCCPSGTADAKLNGDKAPTS
eukprot:CAMPEP_0184310300 /NCGR_PEP_ID=MMETSP1049-20130417/26789_1 /TAXON_ID=77928 /ORGANISM="Proteomonas sulcata, Strain CCMP704" /LENGTH=58 /DNA_ID=CAMNT_0026624191 /DNA_START=258 /DNA_END=434 /DNA_ORIENTATION=+